jgi:hypothetical protein
MSKTVAVTALTRLEYQGVGYGPGQSFQMAVVDALRAAHSRQVSLTKPVSPVTAKAQVAEESIHKRRRGAYKRRDLTAERS